MKAPPRGLIFRGDDMFVLKFHQCLRQPAFVRVVDGITEMGRIEFDADDVRRTNEPRYPESTLVAGANEGLRLSTENRSQALSGGQ